MSFRDATQQLRQACSQLHLGQMVAVPDFTLMDSMSAIQIMDARMDSGMELPPHQMPSSDRLPPSVDLISFDPFQPLQANDVIWIMDRLLACEAAWHLGSTLSQTIYTCLYFHYLKALCQVHPSFASQNQPQLVYKVLRSYILAIAKTCDIVWKELTKQNVYDGEDFTADKSGLNLFETTDRGHVVSQIQDSLDYLQDSNLDKTIVDSLKARLSFRKQFLCAVSLLDDGDNSMLLDVTLHAKFAKRHLAQLAPSEVNLTSASPPSAPSCSNVLPIQDPSRTKAPSQQAMSSFDPAYNRKLVANVPLKPISLYAPHQTWTFFDQIMDSLQDLVTIRQRPSVLGWKSFFTYRAVTFQTKPAAPYIRSLFQSAVCDRNLVAGRLPLDWLTETYFSQVALVDPLLFKRLARANHSTVEGGSQLAWNQPPSLAQSVSYFSQKMAGHLVNYLSCLSHNRARQKRSLSKAYKEWVTLSEEASNLDRRIEETVTPQDYLPGSLFAATQHIALEIMTHVIFSGFELELYHPDDWESMFWIGSKVLNEQSIVCTDLRNQLLKRIPQTDQSKPTLEYLDSQIDLAKSLEALCISTILMVRMFPCSHRSRQWPLPNPTSSSSSLAKSTFTRRIQWIQYHDSSSSIDSLWSEFIQFQNHLSFTNIHSKLIQTLTCCQQSLSKLNQTSCCFPFNLGGGGGGVDDFHIFLNPLLEIVSSHLNLVQHSKPDGFSWSFHVHPWFPIFSINQSD